MRRSGLSAEELFIRGEGIVYDDFTILDTFYTDMDKEDITLETELGKGIVLKTPIIASPMDTVTSTEMCIAIALEGGIGCIHYNFRNPDGSRDIDAQIEVIRQVKRYENGFIENPITVSPDMTIDEVIKIGEENSIRGKPITTFPVTYQGNPHSKLIGLLRDQDYSRSKNTDMTVRDRMFPLDQLIYGEMPITLEEANDMLFDKHRNFLPIVENGKLRYLVTRKDLDKNEQYPLATKDENKRLRVLFAVDTRHENSDESLGRGFDAGADGCIVDTSQGFTKYATDMIKYIQKKWPDKLIIGGNIATPEAYRHLDDLGIDTYRCGQGSGSICTTAGTIGVGRASAAGIYDCANVRGKMKTIADGGLRQVGDIMKALTIGADMVMLGSMLAGTDESPGEVLIDQNSGGRVKVYRGMGSAEAMGNNQQRGYGILPQGISGHVKHRGSIHTWVPLIRDGLTHALHTQNCSSIQELHKKMYSGQIRFERRTASSVAESKPHI